MAGIIEEGREPTRSNLLELEDQLELARSGREKLEQVQERLISEFMDIFEEWKEEAENVDEQYENASKKLTMARAMEGDIALRSIAQANQSSIELDIQVENVAGVNIPQIESTTAQRDLDERGYGVLGTSAKVDETTKEYEELIDQIVRVAELETAMQKLLDEIKRIKRRVNAFEYQIIPNLEREHDRIEQRLMERERQEIFQLKKIKDKKEEEESNSHT